MQRTKIDWGVENLYTWNPVVGCKRGCEYCYAKRIHERFNKTPFSQLEFFPDRLEQPLKLKKPATIFVGSMSDIEYWSPEQKERVIKICEVTPQHTYMFLSKNPYSYGDLYKWPENCMLGLTVTEGESDQAKEYLLYHATNPDNRVWLSIEPLLGNFVKDSVSVYFERVIVGAMSGANKVKPKKEWIESVKDVFPAEKIYWKPSIRGMI